MEPKLLEDRLRKEQNRTILGYENPELVPVDIDQWKRLLNNIKEIRPVPERNNNTRWAMFGFCGSMLISLLFYATIDTPNYIAISLGIGLLIGLFVAAFAFGSSFSKDKQIQANTISRCQKTIDDIENRLKGDNKTIQAGTTGSVEGNMYEPTTIEYKDPVVRKNKEILADIRANSKIGK